MAEEGDYVVIDLETTGLSRHTDKITEIAAVKVKNKEIIGQFSTLVNPRCRIPHFITHLTGINNKMVKDAPFVEEVLPAFVKFLGGSVFVAHQAIFDYNFLNQSTTIHLKKEIMNPTLCTRKLAYRLVPELSSWRLQMLCNHFNVTNLQAHRAMGDALATTQILNHLLGILEKRGVKDKESILSFQQVSRAKLNEF